MRFSIDKERFLNAVSKVLPCIDSRPSIPVLSCILLELRDDILYLTTSDINMTMRIHVGVNEDSDNEEGSVAIAGKLLSGILAKLPSGEVELKCDESNLLKISMENIWYDLLGISHLEFPEFSLGEDNESQEMLACDLYRLLNSVMFATSSDETRLTICGIYLSQHENNIISAGTDGRRLALVEKSFDWDVEKFEAIIPNKAVSTILKILKNYDDELLVELGVNESSISLQVNNVCFSSKTAEGAYPNYNQVLPNPESFIHEFELSIKPFVSAVERSLALVGSLDRSIKLHFDGETIKISTSENANVYSERIGECKSDKPLTFSLNPDFFLDGLKAVYQDTCLLQCIDKTAPIQMSLGDWKYVIMPMRS